MKRTQVTLTAILTRVRGRLHARAVEWLISLITITLGVQLAFWPDLFTAPTSRAYYAELEHFAPQSWWAIALLIAAGGRFGALLINGAWRFSPHARVATGLFDGHVWLAISFGLLHLERASLGIAITPWIVVADIYAISRAAADAGIADTQAKVAARSYGG